MSPEQAQGRSADKGSDIWAFGCVLFEMLTGQRAFPGDSVSDTIAAVLHTNHAGRRCRPICPPRFTPCSGDAWNGIASDGSPMHPRFCS